MQEGLKLLTNARFLRCSPDCGAHDPYGHSAPRQVSHLERQAFSITLLMYKIDFIYTLSLPETQEGFLYEKRFSF